MQVACAHFTRTDRLLSERNHVYYYKYEEEVKGVKGRSKEQDFSQVLQQRQTCY